VQLLEKCFYFASGAAFKVIVVSCVKMLIVAASSVVAKSVFN